MFLDEKELRVTAGKGGDGAALFRREKYVPYGGPDGGDGGRGGDVVFFGALNVHALAHLAHTDHLDAEPGRPGGHQRSTGKSGESLRIAVPLGTVIYEERGSEWVQLAEITEENQTFLVARGGNGGWGNWHFKSSIQQAPERHNSGQPGETKQVRLVLKLIADVGLVGLPNAGKSTLLSSISAARPKIADYQFTTLEPQLGVATWKVGRESYSLIIADLPGLIEGASKGKGLGDTFLKHIERTRSIIHCLDASVDGEELLEHYETIRNELAAWSSVLADKPEVIALTKIDLLPKEDLLEKVARLEKVTGKKVYPISAVAQQGLTDLLTASL